MSESNEPELDYQKNGRQFLPDSEWSYTYTRNAAEIGNFLILQKEIEDKLAKGEPVYVQILDDRRKGSIGRLKTITFEHKKQHCYSGDLLRVSNIEVIWDKRKNSCRPYAHEVEYLPDWTDGTRWAWNPKVLANKTPRVIPYDCLNQEIEVGHFVCFVHRRYGNISMKFGSVSRLTDKGGVFVKTLKLRDGEQNSVELKAFAASELVIVNDKLMSRLLMAKLAAD